MAKSVFPPAEIAYFGSQRLGRIAAVGSSGQPHTVPVVSRGLEGERRRVTVRP